MQIARQPLNLSVPAPEYPEEVRDRILTCPCSGRLHHGREFC